MPEPLSWKSGLGIKVATLPCLRATGVPLTFDGVDMVVAFVLVLVVAHVVEDEELELRPPVGDIGDACRLEIGLSLLRDAARVTRVSLLRDRVLDIAEDGHCG